MEPLVIPPVSAKVFPARYRGPAFEQRAIIVRQSQAHTYESRKATACIVGISLREMLCPHAEREDYYGAGRRGQ